jgi:hypothetical protein
MVGTVSFNLEPPDGRAAGAADNTASTPDPPPPRTEQEATVGATVPDTPRLPFAPDPGTYTQLWTSQAATTTASDMKEDMESYMGIYNNGNPDYGAIQTTILNSSDWIGFLTVLAGNQVVLVHSLGLFSSGLGRPTPAHNRMFGLLGEKVGSDLPPIVMVPSAGLVPWIKVQTRYQPDDDELTTLEDGTRLTISKPVVEVDESGRSVQNICFITKAWAPYFLAPMTPWDALKVFRRLLSTIPPPLRDGFDFLGSWLACVCTHDGADGDDSLLKAKWQSPPAERRMIAWMQRRTLYLNAVPATGMTGAPSGNLDPQECFNKALETVAALRPPSETTATKRYTPAELQRLRAACSLSVPEMETTLPDFHEQLLTEGRTKKGTEAVLAHALRPQEDTDDPGLVYVSPELVSDIKDCKYGLGWDTSYRNCHRGISPFAVPHMSMKHQQERSAYQDRLSRASSTTLGDIEKGESSPSPAPQDYHGLLQLLSNYIRLLKVVIGTRSAHTREVVAIRRTLRAKVDLYIDIGPREVIYLLWAIFLDAREFLSHQIGPTERLPESQLRYTTNFLGVGRIPLDIMGVPVEQFGAKHPRGNGSTRDTVDSTISSSSASMFRPAEWVSPKNPGISDDISAITMPLMDKFPNATTEALMAHGDLKYDDIRVGNKGACLNYNLFGICKDKACTYRHARAQPTQERINMIADKLKPAIQSFMAAGAPSNAHGTKRKR